MNLSLRLGEELWCNGSAAKFQGQILLSLLCKLIPSFNGHIQKYSVQSITDMERWVQSEKHVP